MRVITLFTLLFTFLIRAFTGPSTFLRRLWVSVYINLSRESSSLPCPGIGPPSLAPGGSEEGWGGGDMAGWSHEFLPSHVSYEAKNS